MPHLPLLQIDAFTTRPLSGNACAVVLDADELDTVTMQAIALEMNLSETAFVLQSESADFRARYFTPVEEIPLAGHPTIATTHALVEAGRLDPDVGRITLELPAGVIPIDINMRGPHPVITMSQLRPDFRRTYAADEVLPTFGLDPKVVRTGSPIQTVSTGTPQLMIPVGSLDDLRRAQLDVSRYEELREAGDFFSPHLFCTEGVTERGATFARHFGLPPDTYEDPFTGSATGGMAAYLWHHGLIDAPCFVAEQGHWMGRPGSARVEVVGLRDDIETVRVGGSAVTVFRGELAVGS